MVQLDYKRGSKIKKIGVYKMKIHTFKACQCIYVNIIITAKKWISLTFTKKKIKLLELHYGINKTGNADNHCVSFILPCFVVAYYH